MPATGFPGPWPGNEKKTIINFSNVPMGQVASTGAAPATTINTTNQWLCPGGYPMECYNTTASTNVMPIMGTLANNGINIDNITGAAAKTIEITEGNSPAIKNAFVARTAAPFFVRATFNINTLANVNVLKVGFRKQQTYNATETNYTDLATFGVIGTSGHLQAVTQVASGGFTTTDSGNVAVAGTNFTVQVNVDGSGNVTYLRDVTGNGPLIAPTTVVAYQFGAVTVVPYIYYTTITSHTEVDLVSYVCGFQ
jgi:hypothetical protein